MLFIAESTGLCDLGADSGQNATDLQSLMDYLYTAYEVPHNDLNMQVISCPFILTASLKFIRKAYLEEICFAHQYQIVLFQDLLAIAEDLYDIWAGSKLSSPWHRITAAVRWLLQNAFCKHKI